MKFRTLVYFSKRNKNFDFFLQTKTKKKRQIKLIQLSSYFIIVELHIFPQIKKLDNYNICLIHILLSLSFFKNFIEIDLKVFYKYYDWFTFL